MILDVGTLKNGFSYVLKDDWKVELSQPNYIKHSFWIKLVNFQSKLRFSDEVKDLLRYINGVMDLGIHYHQGEAYELASFLNANWASDVHDWKSRIDFFFAWIDPNHMWKQETTLDNIFFH